MLPSALLMLLALTGCATLAQPHLGHLKAADDELRECAHWIKRLDDSVAQAGVNDFGARRIAGFPYLRIDRFGAFLRDSAAEGSLREDWMDYLSRLGQEGRQIEIGNLSDRQLEGLQVGDREASLARAQDCADKLRAADSGDANAAALLQRRAFVEDDYSAAKRALGLYELTRIPFHLGVEAWQEGAAQAIDAVRRGAPPQAPLVTYHPPDVPVYRREEVRAILTRAKRNPLGIPTLSGEERGRLFATYAPLFEIETAGEFDRIGRLEWSGDGSPTVDHTRPVVYHRLGYTRVEDRTLLQLVYTAWFSERPANSVFDVLAGKLDGITWRVTLAPDGEPILFDSIHPCGCYHMFFPTPRAEPLPAPAKTLEWAFVPARLPGITQTSRVVVSLQTRTHYLRDVRPDSTSAGTAYGFAEYDDLRRLPLPGGGTRSLFEADGLVAGSERGERFLFWPMGIASPGAMRQAGSQATAFVGRRHFDDADLIAKRFRLRW